MRSRPVPACLLLLHLLGLAPAPAPAARGETPDAVARVDDYLQRLAGFGYSGAVLVAVDGRVVLRRGYGLADRERGTPNRPDTLFDVGSLAKSFTAAAALLLAREGRLRLDAPIGAYLPGVPDDKRAVTVHQLLTHTSGLTAPAPAYEPVSRRAAVERILCTPLQFPPGSKWAYANAGYVLLAAIVETASGEPFQQYLRAHVFRPAGMSSTGFWGTRLPATDAARLARGYDERGVVTDLRRLSGETWNDMGSGQVVSTVDDLYRWQRCLESRRLLTAAEVNAMLTPAVEVPPSDSYYTESYGYGMWAQRLADGTRRFHHGGDFLGFGSELIWLPDRGVVVVSLCNVRRDLYPVHRRADRAIPDLLSGADVPAPPPFVPLSQARRQALLGDYVLEGGGRLRVAEKDGGLVAAADGDDAAILLDGHLERRGELARRSEETRQLLDALLRDAPSPVVGRALDAAAKAEVQAELATLGEGRGALKGVRIVGTYVGGMLGRFDTTIAKVAFERGVARYKVQWDEATVVGTDVDAPDLAATTPLQATSAHELVGWNIVTLRSFVLRFDPDLRALTIVTNGQAERAVREAARPVSSPIRR